MGLIYSVSVLFFTFMIFRMYLKKDIRPYMTSRVVTHNSRVVASGILLSKREQTE